MLTPQEVAEHGFSKARVGGYSMKEVDDFLDQLTVDYTTLHGDNARLKEEIETLNRRIEEYRETEEAMRSTLLSAQKMAKTIVEEAEEEKTKIISEAEADGIRRKAELEQAIAESEDKLALAQANAQQFIAQMRDLVNEQSNFLDLLPDMTVSARPEPEAPAEEPVPDSVPEQAPAAPAEEPQEAATVTVDAAETVDTGAEDASADSRIDFDNLKFGKDYEIE